MIKCLVVDDDLLICDLIKHFCSKQFWIESCLSVTDGDQALQAIAVQKFDLIFLDFNLPDINGKQILSLIPSDIKVIMVTSELDFGAESYEYPQIIDFLTKPVSYERFLKAMLKYRSIILDQPVEQKKEKILVKDGVKTVIIHLKDIRYIKSDSNYVLFYLDEKKVMSLQSLKQLEHDLTSNFVRIQKSYIINLNYLESMDADDVIVAGERVPIGPKHKERLKLILKDWV